MQGIGGAHHNMLTEVGPDGSLEPALATEWEASPDAVTWTFRLRKDVVFHNGKTLSAEAVIASLDHHRGEDSKSAAKVTVDAIRSMKALDAHTLGNVRMALKHAIDREAICRDDSARLRQRRQRQPHRAVQPLLQRGHSAARLRSGQGEVLRQAVGARHPRGRALRRRCRLRRLRRHRHPVQLIIHDEGGAVIPMFANYVNACSDRVAYGPVMGGNIGLDGLRIAER